MVRLIANGVGGIVQSLLFQFLMVRLIDLKAVAKGEKNDLFQCLMVRLIVVPNWISAI